MNKKNIETVQKEKNDIFVKLNELTQLMQNTTQWIEKTRFNFFDFLKSGELSISEYKKS